MDEKTIRSIIGEQNVVALPPDTTVRAAAKVMARQRIGAVPVVELGKLVGIFTERDLMNRVIAGDIDTDVTKLADVMTADPSTIDIGVSIAEALQVMVEGGFRHLPVVRGSTLVGIISMRDIPAEYWGLTNGAAAAGN